MSASFGMIGFVELLFLLSGGGLFGMPPGERDELLLRCIPDHALFYSEWSARSAGEEGAPGVDGLVADPEVRLFVEQFERAVLTVVDRELGGGDREQQIVQRAVPPLVKQLLKRPGCLAIGFESQPGLQDGGAGPPSGPEALLQNLRFVLVVNGGDEADEIAEHLQELLELLPEQLRTENLQRQTIPLPVPGASLTLHREKNYFVLGFGEGTIDAAVAGIQGERQGLADNESFQAGFPHVQFERLSNVSWIDVKSTVQTVTVAVGIPGVMVQGFIQVLGLESVDTMTSATGVVEGQIQSKTYLATQGRTDGVLALTAGAPLKTSHLELIPADADLVMAYSLSLPKLLDAIREIVRQIDPNSLAQVDGTVEQLERELNLSLKEDIFPAFGDAWTFYDSPGGGGFFVTGLVGSLEVRDPQKAYQVVTQVAQILKEALPGEYEQGFRRRGAVLAQTKFMDRTLYYVNIIGDDDVPFAPTFCVTEKQLLVAPHPQPLKSHLRFLAEADPEQSFAEKVAKGRLHEDQATVFLSHCDAKKFVELLYAFVPYLGQVIASEMQSQGFPLDVFAIPSARAILPYVGDSGTTVTRLEQGLLFESRKALPSFGGSALLMGVPAMLRVRSVAPAIEIQAVPVEVQE